MNDFQKRVLTIAALIALVVTIDAVFANPKAFDASHHDGHFVTDLQSSH